MGRSNKETGSPVVKRVTLKVSPAKAKSAPPSKASPGKKKAGPATPPAKKNKAGPVTPYISPVEAIFGANSGVEIEEEEEEIDQCQGIGSFSQIPVVDKNFDEIEFNIDEEKEEVGRKARIAEKRHEIEWLKTGIGKSRTTPSRS